jgi:membrane protease YdiL (CAAX protease family)
VGWSIRFPRRGLLILLFATGGFSLYFLSLTKTISVPENEQLAGWLATFPVALFEETCFRGLLFLSAERIWGTAAGAFISSTAFTLYHWGAQPIHVWPCDLPTQPGNLRSVT